MAGKIGTQMISMRVPEEWWQMVSDTADERGKTMTGLVIEAVREYLGFVCHECGQTLPAGKELKKVPGL